MTRTVFLGQPSQKMRDAYAAIRSANEQVEAVLKPGVTGKAMHELAERALADAGFAGKMGHSLGHGVGIDIHERPALSPRGFPGNYPGCGCYVSFSFAFGRIAGKHMADSEAVA